MPTIGFIGLGAMGQPMAENLLRQGMTLYVYDVVAAGATALEEQGAQVCQSVKALAQQADIIITSVQTSEQVIGICSAPDGIFNQAKPGSYFIDCSSIDVTTTKTLHAMAMDKKIHMLDAPVSGGVVAAKNAALTVMVGGSKEDFIAMQPILSLIGKKIIHAGTAGNGQAAKICNNLLLAISMIGVAEAFTLAKKLGLDQKTFFDISSNASGQCWAMTSYCPVPDIIPNVPANNGYVPGFKARMMLKDLHLGEHAAEAVDAAIPLGLASMKLYEEFVNQGYGDMDFSGIIEMIEG